MKELFYHLLSSVGISSNAAKERINKIVFDGVIRNFIVRINPVIFGCEKEYILILRNIDKTIKERDILNRISLLGESSFRKHSHAISLRKNSVTPNP
jgi:DNA-binding Lrp family transcriptional regulator